MAINLTIVSQERRLLSESVEQVSAPTPQGQITILPNHIPLFSQLVTGELLYVQNGTPHSFVVSQGFLDMDPDNTLTVIVDSAVHERQISVAQAEEAIKRANETLQRSEDQRELMMAEASLRQAMMEIKLAQKTNKRG